MLLGSFNDTNAVMITTMDMELVAREINALISCNHNCHLARWWLCQPAQDSANAGEYNLRLGITKELHPELIATHQGRRLTQTSLC